MSNKVKYNIREFHYAPMTSSGYGTPVALPGTVSISLEPQGENTPFYADGIEYYTTSSNFGYEGELENALVDDAFRMALLGEVKDSNNNLVELADAEAKKFAFGFVIDGNAGPIYFWFYNAIASRPAITSSTKEESIEVQTDTITISTKPDENGYVRIKSTDTSTTSSWFTAVVTPDMSDDDDNG